MRRTKIVATMGPASESPKVVEDLVLAGVNVVRLNFSHGSAEEHKQRADMVRAAAKKHGQSVAILGDLQGPKIRIDRFESGKITLNDGDSFILDAALGKEDGNQERVGIAYKLLPDEVKPDDELWLDDGRIILKVTEIDGVEVRTTVVHGGVLSNNKGINLRGGGLSANALTEHDIACIKIAAEIDVDYLAVSFPRNEEDMKHARELMDATGTKAYMVAKIERAEAIEKKNLDGIIKASDAIMIARGDLGVEIGDAKLPIAQKRLIKRARKLDKVVITATQMMETMIDNPIPTRAEVFDVANAVMDGTDAVMLSGETAVGKDPARVVRTMSNICEEAEQSLKAKRSNHRMDVDFKRVDEAIAMATMYIGNHMKVKAIAALTESGATARWMSRISSGISIYALTHHEKTCKKVALYRGVYPELLNECITDPKEANRLAVEHLIEQGIVKENDLVMVTKGDLMGKRGGTNMLKVIRVGDHEYDH